MNRFVLGFVLGFLVLLALAASAPLLAADNAIILTPGTGVTERSIDVGVGVQAPGVVLVNSSGTNLIGAGTSVPVSGSVTVSGSVSATQSGTWTVQPGNVANTTAWLVNGTGGVFPSSQSGVWSVIDNINQWNSVALGSPTAWGTAPTGNVVGMNVNVVGCSNSGSTICNANGQQPMANSAPVTIANNQSAIPISGTVTVTGTIGATQSGTWTVQPGNVANTTAWLVNGTGGVFPSTQSGTWTVQPGNVANTTAWLVTGAGGTFPATQSGAWTVTSNITLWNSVALASPTAWGTAPAGNVPGMNVNLVACSTTVCNNNGQAPMLNSAPVVIASNQSTLPVNTVNWNGVALGSPTAWGTAPTGNVVSVNANIVACVSGGSVCLPTGQAAMAASSPVVIAANQAYLGTASGWTPGLQGALSTTVQAIKASAGQLGYLHCYNSNASAAFVQVFNVAAGSVTLGTTTPTLSVGIPPTNSNGFAYSLVGVQFSTAMSFAATTTFNGSTGPTTGLTCSYAFN